MAIPLDITPELQEALVQIAVMENPLQEEIREVITKAVMQQHEPAPVVPETPIERAVRMMKEYHTKMQAMAPKLEEDGWYYVWSGKCLPKVDQEILFVIDKRMTQDGDMAKVVPSVFKNTALMKVRHGYVNRVDYEPEYGLYSIETRPLRMKGGLLRITNGSSGEIVLWRPMIELPSMPRLTDNDYRY